ncbi:MAG: FlgO family outer membrane protein [Desulfovibrionaceae bacterium]
MARIIRLLVLAALCVTVFAAVAMARQPESVVQGYDAASAQPSPAAGLLTANLYAADALAANMAGRMDARGLIVAATLVNLTSLDNEVPFGRVVSQQIASRLIEHGFKVVEMRMRESMALRPSQGEFLLSRDAAQIAQDTFSAEYALLGFYEATRDEVYVSLRLARLDTRAVIAAYEYTLANDLSVHRLLDTTPTDALWRAHVRRRPEAVLAAPAMAASAMTPPVQAARRVAPAAILEPPTQVAPPTRLGPGAVPERDLPANFPALSPPTDIAH